MKYLVISMAFDLTDEGLPAVPMNNDFPHLTRREVIDTETNELFANCKCPADVEATYEAFWNYLNESDKTHAPYFCHNPNQKVKVIHAFPSDQLDP